MSREGLTHADIAQRQAKGRTELIVGAYVNPAVEQNYFDYPEVASDDAWASERVPGPDSGFSVTVETVDPLRDRDELALVEEDRLEGHFKTPEDLAKRFRLNELPELEQLKEEGE